MLLQVLIFDEIVIKRLPLIEALRSGLKQLGIIDLCKQYPGQARDLFIYKDVRIDAEKFISLMQMPRDMDAPKAQAYGWFQEYIMERMKEDTGMAFHCYEHYCCTH